MDGKIDYASFTIELDLRGAGQTPDAWMKIRKSVRKLVGKSMDGILTSDLWEQRGGRKHYAFSLYETRTHTAIWWGGAANHVLVEVTGTGCQYLRELDKLQELVQKIASRCTRLDVAVDFASLNVLPLDFVQAGYNARFKSRATFNSATGSTEYVGSMNSARYARVYMYNKPHPRAGILRVEHVLRDENAKAACRVASTDGLALLISQLGNTFAWKHPAWTPDVLTEGKLKATRADKHGAGTLRWIEKAVKPALSKAFKDGLIDKNYLAEFLSEIIIGKPS